MAELLMKKRHSKVDRISKSSRGICGPFQKQNWKQAQSHKYDWQRFFFFDSLFDPFCRFSTRRKRRYFPLYIRIESPVYAHIYTLHTLAPWHLQLKWVIFSSNGFCADLHHHHVYLFVPLGGLASNLYLFFMVINDVELYSNSTKSLSPLILTSLRPHFSFYLFESDWWSTLNEPQKYSLCLFERLPHGVV